MHEARWVRVKVDRQKAFRHVLPLLAGSGSTTAGEADMAFLLQAL